MSKFTTELRFICEQLAEQEESQGFSKVDEIIASARTKIFDFNYPIFDENYKGVLETKILRHYYTREISDETYGLWKLRLQNKLNDIMPYYNQMYKSELLEFNPFYTSELETKSKNIKNGNIINNSRSKNINAYSETPQGSLERVEDLDYLTNATINKNNDQSNSISNDVDEYLQTIKGKNDGNSYSKLLSEYRETFVNIDLMIIEELSELFFCLWE